MPTKITTTMASISVKARSSRMGNITPNDNAGRPALSFGVMFPMRDERAFTLIEAMVVVILVGILAVVAGLGYRRWVRSSYMGEAQDMLTNIRMAEETFRSENGAYLAT